MTLSKNLKIEILKLIGFYNKNNANYILKEIDKLIISDNPKPRTIIVRYSNVKKLCKEYIKDDNFCNKIKADNKLINDIIIKNEFIRDNKKMIEINKELLYKLSQLYKSDNINDLLTWLLLVSGRRISEIMTSQFKHNKNDKKVYVSGLKKTRSNHSECEIKILVSKTKFFKILSKYRRLQRFYKIQNIHRNLNRYLKKWNLHSHSLRNIYIQYLYKFRNPYNIKINEFIRQGLCQKTITASLSYTNIKLSKDINKDFIR